VNSAAVTLCVASQQAFILLLFRYDSVRKLLDTPTQRIEFRTVSFTENVTNRACKVASRLN
jgi:hypothetical protein